MAFNPVHHFRKYQKVWMAAVLLLCMITFVLCTGVGGDLSDMVMRWFARRSGTLVAKVDGRSYYSYDLAELKTQRSIANQFMKKAAEFYIKGIDEFLLEVARDTKKIKEEDRKIILPRMQLFKEELTIRSKKPWYFDSGTKLDELADFLLWKSQADRLGIYLVEDHVWEMVGSELLKPAIAHFSGQQIPTNLAGVMLEVRRDSHRANDSSIFRALEDEFRVRMAQLAIINAQPDAYRDRDRGAEQIKIQYFQALENPGFRHGLDSRAVATPEQLWEQFKKKRAEFDVALVPIAVEQFLDKIKPPTEQELQAFFNEHRKTKYDPTSDKPGFEIPHRAKIEWITADPESPFYKKLAKTAHLLEVTPPIAWGPMQSTLGPAVRYALGRTPFDVTLYQDFQKLRSQAHKYMTASLDESDVLTPILDKLYKPTATSSAAIVGAAFRNDLFASVPAAYRLPVYEKHKKEIPAFLATEAKERSPAYATLIASAANGSPFMSLAQYHWSGMPPRFLPIDVVRDDLTEFAEKRIAGSWINRNMLATKKELENPRIIGKSREVFELMLQPLIDKYGLTRGGTKDFQDKYSVSKAKELAPLREAFERSYHEINQIEGRLNTDRALKEDDFYRLFFESNEGFSTGVVLFDARVWPPYLKAKDVRTFHDPLAAPKVVALFEIAEKPFLFWKTADQPAQPAESLAQLRDRVEHAWKVEKARQQVALPQAKDVAERLQKLGSAVGPALHEEAKKLGKDPIYLNNLALMVKYTAPPRTVDYGGYQLPPNTIDYPREDMVKHLLSLTELKEEPIKIDNKELDEVNRKLWETTKGLPVKEGLGRQVQILTNKPRTMYYVATVAVPPHASKADFDEAMRQAVGLPGGPYNAFLRRVHDQNAKEYQQAIIAQLRNEAGWWIDQNEVKTFDQDTAP